MEAAAANVVCGTGSVCCGVEPPLRVQYIKLQKAVYVWVGTSGPPTMASLVASTPGASTTLFGEAAASEDLGARLSRRLGCVVLLSFDAADSTAADLPEIEAELFKLLK